MSNYPYCYNIKEGTKFFVAYFDKEKKQNTLLKCVAIGKHCHVRFGNYDYGYGAFTDVKVETPLGIRFITLTYNVSKGERGQCLMHLGPSLGVYVPSDEEVMVELYANVDGYKNGSQMMLVPTFPLTLVAMNLIGANYISLVTMYSNTTLLMRTIRRYENQLQLASAIALTRLVRS